MANEPTSTVPDSSGTRIEIVVNARSGSGRGPDPGAELRAALPDARIVELGEDDDVNTALRQASLADAIGVCGGDGTVNAAATVALDADRALLVVPGGTLNHFARAIGIAEISDAVEAFASGAVTGVDVGTIGERHFVNTASFGAYSDLVDERERLEHRIGKWPALMVAAVRVLRRATPCSVAIDGIDRRIWLIFIGNCCYEPSGAFPRERPALADGRFDVRIVDAARRWSRTRFLLATAFGRTDRSRGFEQRTVARFSVKSHDGPLRLACDGETFDGPHEVIVEKARTRLRVFVPSSSAR